MNRYLWMIVIPFVFLVLGANLPTVTVQITDEHGNSATVTTTLSPPTPPPVAATMPAVVFTQSTTSPSQPYSHPVATVTTQPAPANQVVVGTTLPANLVDNTEYICNGPISVLGTSNVGNHVWAHSTNGIGVLTYTGPVNGSVLQIAQSSSSTVENLRLVGASAAQAVLVGGANSLYLHNLQEDATGPASFVNAASLGSGPNGLLIAGCTTTGLGAYSVFTSGTMVIDGCNFSAAQDEDLIRGTGNVTVSNPTLSIGQKCCIAPQGGSWAILNPTITTTGNAAAIAIGPVTTAQAWASGNIPTVTNTELIGGSINGAVNIGPGVAHIFVGSGLIEADNASGINVQSATTGTLNGVSTTLSSVDVEIVGETFKNLGTDGAAVTYFPSFGTGAVLTGNTYIAPKVSNSNYFASNLKIGDGNLSGFAAIGGNSWQTLVNNGFKAPNGNFYLGPIYGADWPYFWTLQQWNAAKPGGLTADVLH